MLTPVLSSCAAGRDLSRDGSPSVPDVGHEVVTENATVGAFLESYPPVAEELRSELFPAFEMPGFWKAACLRESESLWQRSIARRSHSRALSSVDRPFPKMESPDARLVFVAACDSRQE